jgi:hypothetical protein
MLVTSAFPKTEDTESKIETAVCSQDVGTHNMLWMLGFPIDKLETAD